MKHSLTWLKFFLIGGAIATLTACGNGSTYAPFEADSIVALGDAYLDLGAPATADCDAGRSGRYTVNTGCDKDDKGKYKHNFQNSALLQLADNFGIKHDKVKSYAKGQATLAEIKQQVKKMPASDFNNANKKLFIISAGTQDLINKFNKVDNTTVNNMINSYMDIIKTLKNKGAKNIVVFGPYNLTASVKFRNDTQMSQLSIDFNGILKTTINEEFPHQPIKLYNFDDFISKEIVERDKLAPPACEKDITECTYANKKDGVDIEDNWRVVFADELYLTPKLMRRMGNDIYDWIQDTIWEE